MGPNQHGAGDGTEILLVETAALEDEGVKAEIAKLALPEGAVVICDPWIYGTSSIIRPCEDDFAHHLLRSGSDGVDDDKRMWQCFLYLRDPVNSTYADSNHYAHPLAISPVIDAINFKVIRIDLMPTGADNTTKPTTPYKLQPPSEYTPEHQELRSDLRPLNVVQPEGASFKATQTGEAGEAIEWQKWSFRVGFNQREGMVLYNVCNLFLHRKSFAYFNRSAMMAEVFSIVCPCPT